MEKKATETDRKTTDLSTQDRMIDEKYWAQMENMFVGEVWEPWYLFFSCSRLPYFSPKIYNKLLMRSIRLNITCIETTLGDYGIWCRMDTILWKPIDNKCAAGLKYIGRKNELGLLFARITEPQYFI